MRRDPPVSAYLGEVGRRSSIEPVPPDHDVGQARLQSVDHGAKFPRVLVSHHDFLGTGGRLGSDQVPEGRATLLDRGVQRDRGQHPVVLDQFPHLLHRQLRGGGQFRRPRIATQLDSQGPGEKADARHLLVQVDRHADRPRVHVHRAQDELPDPPVGVGGELEAAAVIELLHRADQPSVPLLDEVEQGDPGRGVATSHGSHEPEVGHDELLVRSPAVRHQPLQFTDGCVLGHRTIGEQVLGVAAHLDPLRQVRLLLGCQQGSTAGLPQVSTDVVSRGPGLGFSAPILHAGPVPPGGALNHRDRSTSNWRPGSDGVCPAAGGSGRVSSRQQQPGQLPGTRASVRHAGRVRSVVGRCGPAAVA